MKKLLFLFLNVIIISFFSISASAIQWRLHSTFDDQISEVTDTPDAVYFLCSADIYNANIPAFANKWNFLFKYDKEADELINLNRQNLLSGQLISSMRYNPFRDYLTLIYDDGNIDLIYDNGDVVNIPDFKLSDAASKNVNYIFFDPAEPYIYLATDFGYIRIDDKNGNIKDSRNYGMKVETVGVFKGNILLNIGETTYYSPLSNPNFSVNDLKILDSLSTLREFMPIVGSDSLYCLNGYYGWGYIYRLEVENGNIVARGPFHASVITSITPSKEGYNIVTPDNILSISSNGLSNPRAIYPEDSGNKASSWDSKEFWIGKNRAGFYSRKSDGQGAWTLTRDIMAPNASNVFRASSMAYHPDYGMLVNNHGTDFNFPYISREEIPVLLSGLKDMRWSSLSPLRGDPVKEKIQYNPRGLAIDPRDNDKIYTGSYFSGLLRMSLSDPDDLLHLSNPSDPSASHPSFVKIVDNQKSWDMYDNFCPFSAPAFDKNGVLWTAFYNLDKNLKDDMHAELWYWTPEDRLASTNPSTFRAPSKLIYKNKGVSVGSIVRPLSLKGVENILLYAPNTSTRAFYLIDHNGTISDQNDDTEVEMSNLVDQDGSQVERSPILSLYEDHSANLVWVGTGDGVFTFNPASAMKNPSVVNRIKVARNDGTNLADYLLDKATVNAIEADSSGKKWFATSEGIVVTSSDGRSIVNQFTESNSPLPDNTVYSIAYNPSANSMMVSTAKGLAEIFLDQTTSGGSELNVRAYPNPVRPDYFGYVTIDGLPDNSLVKIADAAGGIVNETRAGANGEAKWDVADFHHKRVASGVYYILVSNGTDTSSWANVAKVLVVN